MSEALVKAAASKIVDVMSELPEDTRPQLIAEVVRGAMADYQSKEMLASFLAGVMDLQGIALVTVEHTGLVLVDATYHAEATEPVKATIADVVSMLRDYFSAHPGAEPAAVAE